MADKKVTELGIAVLPNTGLEAIPVVQGAASKQLAAREISKFGYQDITNDITSARTLALTDQGNWIRSTIGSVITIPSNASVPFAIGTILNGIQAGTGQVILSPVNGTVTINKPADYTNKTRAQGAPWCLIKIAADIWDLVGDLEAL